MTPDIVFELGWLNILAYGLLALAPAVFIGGMTMRSMTGSGESARMATGAVLLSTVTVLGILSHLLGALNLLQIWFTSGLIAVFCWMLSAKMPEPASYRIDAWIAGALTAAIAGWLLLRS